MLKTISRCVGLWLLCMLTPAFVRSVPSLSSDLPIEYDTKRNCSLASGNAEFLNNSLRLQADRIYFFSECAKALAEGNVRVTTESLRLLTPFGAYWNTDKRLESDTFRLEVLGHGVEGKNLKGTIDHLTADKVAIHCNGVQNDATGIHITARKGELHTGEYFELWDAVFHVGVVPLYYTPYYRHDFNESVLRWKVDCSLIQRDKEMGRYLRNDLIFNLGWPVKPGIMFDYYRKRDFLVGGILEYNESLSKGCFKVARIHDGDLDTYKESNPKAQNNRFFAEWRHQGQLSEDTDLLVQMEWMKDKDVIKHFRPDENDATRQHPDNFAEISHRTDNTVTSGLVRYRFNHFQHTQERLPELRFNYLPSPLLDTPFYYQYGLGMSHLREKPLDATISEKELRRLDAYAGLTVPLDLASWCTFAPVVNARMAHYCGLNQSPHYNDYTKVLWQFGFDLRFRAYGDYAYENEYWNIHNFRHLLQPVIQYRYLPHGHRGQEAIPAIDREVQDGNKVSLHEIDLLNRRDIDDLNDMHLVRLGLENFLYTNYTAGQAKQWLHCNLYQDVRLGKEQTQRKLADTFFDFEWDPASFFSFNQFLRMDPNEKCLRESNTSISFSENDLWKITLSHSYTQSRTSPDNQHSVKVSYRLNSTNVISAAFSIDAHKPDLIRQTYTWSTIVAKTWNFDVEFKWCKRQRPITSPKEHWKIRFILTFKEW